MLDTSELALRARLRAALEEDHARLDAKVTRLDISTRAGFVVFAQMHHAAFDALARMAPVPDGRVSVTDLEQFRDALAGDLAHLGHPARAGRPFAPVCAEALDHVVLGSRLGTVVLRRIWQASDDPALPGADRYFSLPAKPETWRSHVADLSAQPGAGQHADGVVADVRRIFHLFESALDEFS